MKARIAHLTIIIFLGFTVTGTWAVSKEGSPTFGRGSGQKINISAEKGSGRTVPGGWETVFGGNVRVQQGDVILTCERLTVEYEDKKRRNNGRQASKKDPIGNVPAETDIKTITASGNVRIVQGDRTAFAGKAVYDNAARTITLTEDPRLWQGGNTVKTQTIIMFLDENRYDTGTGGVEVTINPGKNQKEKEK